MANEIQERLKTLLAKEYGAEVDEQKLIGDQYDLDSLSIVEMYLFIEEEFNIEIAEANRKMKVSLTDLVAVVEGLLNK